MNSVELYRFKQKTAFKILDLLHNCTIEFRSKFRQDSFERVCNIVEQLISCYVFLYPLEKTKKELFDNIEEEDEDGQGELEIWYKHFCDSMFDKPETSMNIGLVCWYVNSIYIPFFTQEQKCENLKKAANLILLNPKVFDRNLLYYVNKMRVMFLPKIEPMEPVSFAA